MKLKRVAIGMRGYVFNSWKNDQNGAISSQLLPESSLAEFDEHLTNLPIFHIGNCLSAIRMSHLKQL
jgi:hypothetical protein